MLTSSPYGDITSEYDVWLARASVLLACAASIIGGLLFALFLPSFAAVKITVGYLIGTALVLARGGTTIALPLRAGLSAQKCISIGLLFGIPVGLAYVFLIHTLDAGTLASGLGTLPAPQRALALLVGLALAPIFETIVAQGWLQTRLTDAFGIRIGALCTICAFAIVHGDTALFALLPAVLLSYLRIRYRSLLSIAVAHATINGIVLLASH